jgi:hypothetical protein
MFQVMKNSKSNELLVELWGDYTTQEEAAAAATKNKGAAGTKKKGKSGKLLPKFQLFTMVFRLLHDGLLALEKATYLCLGLHVVP